MNPESPHSNVVVLRGTVVREPTPRTLPSGSVVVQFDVSTGSSTSPVAWTDPARDVAGTLVAGTDVVVVGEVRRRFFRSAGATQSRTEVVAGAVVPARRRRQVAAALTAAAERVAAAG